MAQMPAVCDNCGATFSSGFEFGGTIGLIKMTGNRAGPCPYCNSMGSVVDGTYEVRDGVIGIVKLLTQPGMTAERIERVRQILESARSADVSEKELADQLDAVSPGFSQILSLMRKAWGNAKSFNNALNQTQGLIAVIALLYSVVSNVHPPANNSGSAAPAAVEMVVRKELEDAKPITLKKHAVRAPVVASHDQAVIHHGHRNSRCPCGSGRKYKHCHEPRAR